MKMTNASVAIAVALMRQPHDHHWGYDLWKQTGVRSGALYPILARMLEQGWLDDGWEDVSTIREKRPPRRYYVVTDEGMRQLGAMARSAATETRFTRPASLGVQVAI